MSYGSLTLEHEMHHADADDGSDGAAGGVGSQVEPLTGAIGCQILLNQLKTAAHGNGSQPGQQEQL